jgi:hypothetical protein
MSGLVIKKIVSKTAFFTQVTCFFYGIKKSKSVKMQVKRKLVQHQGVMFFQS